MGGGRNLNWRGWGGFFLFLFPSFCAADCTLLFSLFAAQTNGEKVSAEAEEEHTHAAAVIQRCAFGERAHKSNKLCTLKHQGFDFTGCTRSCSADGKVSSARGESEESLEGHETNVASRGGSLLGRFMQRGSAHFASGFFCSWTHQ